MLCAFVSITIYLLIIAFCSLRAETRAYVSTIVSKNCDSCWVTPQGHWKRVYRGPWRGAKLTIGKMAGKIVILKFRKERVAHATEIERAGFLTRARPSFRRCRWGAGHQQPRTGHNSLPRAKPFCPSREKKPFQAHACTRARERARAPLHIWQIYIYISSKCSFLFCFLHIYIPLIT